MNLYFSYPKINICFKILGFLDSNYCDIFSRYRLVTNDVFDEIYIKDSAVFKIKGNFDCELFDNLIFKAKEALKAYLYKDPKNNKKLKYLESYSIEVNKNIPSCSGLGGGSSNAATYLVAFNEILELNLSKEILNEIASNIGADVSFFIYNYSSANVYGKGEKILPYEEENLEFSIFTPPLKIETKEVFNEFKKNFKLCNNDLNLDSFSSFNSRYLLSNYNIEFLNDLFLPALKRYPLLEEFIEDKYFFSGSGGSFFKLKNENSSYK